MDLVLETRLATGVTILLVILMYTYVVYPLMMALIGLSARGRADQVKPDQLPAVSLLIPAHNEEDLIDEKIRNSLALDYPDLEILVASDGSTDRTVEQARAFEGIELLNFAKRRGKASVLTDAVQASHGEVLCFCDANVMLHQDALWRMVAHFIDEEVGGVTGDVRLQSAVSSFGLGESLYYRLERSIQMGESNLGAVIGVDGGMYVIRRELFGELPADTVLDDLLISTNVLRSGKKLLYEPTAIANENATELAIDEYLRRVRIGIGAAQFLARGVFPRWTQPCRLLMFASHKLLRWISPWLVLALFAAAFAWSFHEPLAWWILAPGLIALGLALAGAVLPTLRRHWVVTIPFYFVLSELAFTHGIVRGFLFKASGMWQRTSRRKLQSEREA